MPNNESSRPQRQPGGPRFANDVGSLLALGCYRPTYRMGGEEHDARADYAAIGTAGSCRHCHTGMCPVGVTTQDPELEKLDPDVGARGITNYLKALTMELTALARACGKSDYTTSSRTTSSPSPSLGGRDG